MRMTPMGFGGLRSRVGALVRSQREKLQLTQESLAKSAKLSRTSVAMIEHGKQDVTLETFVRIANALNAPPHILLKQAFSESPKSVVDSWAAEILDR